MGPCGEVLILADPEGVCNYSQYKTMNKDLSKDMSIPHFWIIVASKDHVMSGVKGGFAQAGHGRRSGLTRMHTGDSIVYYSPKMVLGGDAPLHAFTALGTIADDEIVQVEMTPDFRLFRRNVKYLYTGDVKIEPLIDDLRFIRNKKSWGYAFRFGLLEIERTILRKSCRDSKKRDKRLNETDGVLQKTDDWTSFLREGSNPFPWIDIIRDGNRADHRTGII